MLKPTLVFILVAVASLGPTIVFAQAPKREDPCSEFRFLAVGGEAPTVTASDVRNLPQCFNGKFIEMIGIYRIAFENSDLYDPTGGEQSTWISFDPFSSAVKRCSPPAAMHLLNRKKGGTFGFIALGVLRRGGGFGHMNGWANELQVICVETVVDLSDPVLFSIIRNPMFANESWTGTRNNADGSAVEQLVGPERRERAL